MSSNEIRDALPDDLDISAFVGRTNFLTTIGAGFLDLFTLVWQSHVLDCGLQRNPQIRHSEIVVL